MLLCPIGRHFPQIAENLDAKNLYGVLTIMAFLYSLPFGLYYEGAATLRNAL